jgi:hypothetical protein
MEVAGVALAIFPLVVEGVANLVKASSRVKTLRYYYYSRALKREARELENELVIFQLTIEKLVHAIGFVGNGYEESRRLLQDPEGPAWKEPEFNEKLEAYLDRAYEPFLKTVGDLLEDLKLLCAKLGINYTTHQIQPVDYFHSCIRRFKYTFGQEVYKVIFDRIHRANDFLKAVTSDSQTAHAWRVKGKLRMKGAGVSALRRRAADLHNCLAQRELWRCSCSNRHLLSLYLGTLDSSNASPEGEVSVFDIALGTIPLGCPKSVIFPSAIWKMMKLECEESKAPPPTTVRFSLQGIAQLMSRPRQTQEVIVSNICASLDPVAPSNSCKYGYLGHLATADLVEHRFGLFSVAWPWRGKSMEPVSELLSRLKTITHGQEGAAVFPRRSRLLIASQLALAVVVLDGSWLRQGWGTQDFVLLREALQSKSSLGVLRDNDALLLPWSLEYKLPTPKMRTSQSDDIRFPTLFTLGITLIELSLGATIEDLKENEDENSDEIVSKRLTARRLLPRVEEQEGDEYAAVVERCLDCPFDFVRRDRSFDNDEFRNLVYDRVVRPLKRNAEIFAHG